MARQFKQQILIGGNAPSTAKTYLNHIAQLAEHFSLSPDELTEEQLVQYLLLTKTQHKPNSMWPLFAAIKSFFTHTVARDWKTLLAVRIPKTRTLPTVLTEEKVWTLLSAIEQPHWHAFFLTLYTCGLRLSDARLLTPGNIDADRQHIHVKKTKNSNERFVPLPLNTLGVLRDYRKAHRNPAWLFPSRAQPTSLEANQLTHQLG